MQAEQTDPQIRLEPGQELDPATGEIIDRRGPCLWRYTEDWLDLQRTVYELVEADTEIPDETNEQAQERYSLGERLRAALTEALAGIRAAVEVKVNGIGHVVARLKAEAEAEEAKRQHAARMVTRYQRRREARENRIKALNQSVADWIAAEGSTKVKGADWTASICANGGALPVRLIDESDEAAEKLLALGYATQTMTVTVTDPAVRLALMEHFNGLALGSISLDPGTPVVDAEKVREAVKGGNLPDEVEALVDTTRGSHLRWK